MAVSIGAAILGGAALGVGGSILGAREQRKAQDRQIAALEGIEARKLGLSREQFEESKRLMAEGKPLRDALISSGVNAARARVIATQQTLAEIEKGPGQGPQFQTALRRGTRGLFQNLGAFGLADSSAAGIAAGELTEGLIARDVGRIDALRGSLFNSPIQGSGSGGLASSFANRGVALQGQASQIGAQRAQALGVSPRAGLFSDIAGVGSAIATAGAVNFFGGGTAANTTPGARMVDRKTFDSIVGRR